MLTCTILTIVRLVKRPIALIQAVGDDPQHLLRGKALPGSAHIPSVATGVRPHTKRSKIGDLGPSACGHLVCLYGYVISLWVLQMKLSLSSVPLALGLLKWWLKLSKAGA